MEAQIDLVVARGKHQGNACDISYVVVSSRLKTPVKGWKMAEHAARIVDSNLFSVAPWNAVQTCPGVQQST